MKKSITFWELDRISDRKRAGNRLTLAHRKALAEAKETAAKLDLEDPIYDPRTAARAEVFIRAAVKVLEGLQQLADDEDVKLTPMAGLIADFRERLGKLEYFRTSTIASMLAPDLWQAVAASKKAGGTKAATARHDKTRAAKAQAMAWYQTMKSPSNKAAAKELSERLKEDPRFKGAFKNNDPYNTVLRWIPTFKTANTR